jgi:SAM-dependent methyltransferase
MTKVQRTHDSFYLLENRHDKPKQLHQEIVGMIRNEVNAKNQGSSFSILDAGCAAGEFAFFLKKSFSGAEICGFDLLPDLISRAKELVKGVDFSVGDITKSNSAKMEHFEYVCCTGVLSIFDNFELVISNLLGWVKPGGSLYLHSLFSNYPVDVNVKYNMSEDYGKNVLESGWNVFSKKSISSFLTTRSDVKEFEFIDFDINIELPKLEDVIRSWTFRDADGKLQITNGLNMLQPHSILKIVKCS